MRDWWRQCKNIPNVLPDVIGNLKHAKGESSLAFAAELKVAKTMGSYSLIREPNGRWLECAGGTGEESTVDPVTGETKTTRTKSKAIVKDPTCRALHEEPIENCQHCPSPATLDKSEFRCLGPGFNGIP